MRRPRKLLSIGHSYVVGLNRRLAHEIAKAGKGDWEVTAVAPTWFQGCRDLRAVALEAKQGETFDLIPVSAHLTRLVHCFVYGSRLRSLLARDWDMVHCWEEPYILAGGQVAWWTPKRTPLIFWTAQNLSKRYPPPFGFIERYCLKRSAGWLACGQSTAKAMLSRGYGGKPYRVMPLGVDLDHFRPDQVSRQTIGRLLGWEGDQTPVIGFLGRFVTEKGVQFLTRVLDRLPGAWRALFVGAGPQESFLHTWASRHGDKVRICSGVKHDEVPQYLNAMDVLCAPSQTAVNWQEQFGRMIIEAFACGVAVVGSDSGEIPHVIGEAGIILGEKDEEGWSQALTALLQNRSSLQALAKRGQERVQANFAWPVIARRHLEFFETILGNREASRGQAA